MEVQQLMEDLLDVGNSLLDEEEGKKVPKLDRNKVWTTLIKIAENEPETLETLYGFLEMYANEDKAFVDETAKCLSEKINVFLDDKKEVQERIKSSIPLFYLMPFIAKENVLRILAATIDLVEKLTTEKKDIPYEFLKPFELAKNVSFQEEIFDELVKFLFEKVNGEKKAFAIAVFACFAQQIIGEKEELIPEVEKVLMNSLDGSVEEKLAGCFLICNLTTFFEEDMPFASQYGDELLKKMLALLVDEDKTVKYRANKAYRELVLSKIFFSESAINGVIEIYPKLQKEDLVGFYKILSAYIFPEEEENDEFEEEEDSVDISILEPILQFATEKIQNGNEYEKGLCIDTFADLGFKDKIIIEDEIDNVIEVANKLVEAKAYESYEPISNLLVVINQQFPSKSIAPKIIPVLVEELNNEKVGNLKHRLYMCSNIALIIANGVCADLLQKIIDFGFEAFENTNEKILFEDCGLFLPLISKLTQETAVRLFKILVEKVQNTESVDNLSGYSHLLSKIVKSFKIDEKLSQDFIKNLMEGNIKILKGKLLYQAVKYNPVIYKLLSKFIKANPTSASSICEKIIDWIPLTQFEGIPAILVPISAGIKCGAINLESSTKLVKIINNLLSKFIESDVDEVITVVNILSDIYSVHPEALNPLETLITNLERFVEMTLSSNEEEDGFGGEIIEAMPQISNLIFNIYSNDSDVEVNEQCLTSLIKFLPYPPQVPMMNEILDNLTQMLDDQERFDSIVVPVLKLFTEMLLMKKSELEEYEFEEETLSNMKSTLKTIVKGNKNIQATITKDFQKSRAKLNRFMALIR